jgi:uncharacterized protein
LIRSFLIAFCLLVAAIQPSPGAEPKFPALTGRVVDEAGVLSGGAVARLTAELAAHEQRTGQQVVVANVKSLDGMTIEDYGVALGRAWGIGQKGSNTGAILLVAPTERKVRIEVGYGLEGELTDATSSLIISRIIVPHFKQGDFEGGIVGGAEQMLRTLGDDLKAPAPVRTEQPQQDGRGSIGSIILTFLIFGFFMWSFRRRGGGLGGMILPMMIASSWGGRGGGSSFGGDGGGFSGGGGSFGGGGSSGSW